MEAAPDFVLGERGEYKVTDFDGHVRECFVLGQETVPLSDTEGGGHFVWVRVEPPFPVNGGEPLDELVLCGRYIGRELCDLSDQAITVNVFTITRPLPASGFPALGSLQLAKIGEVARTPSLLSPSQEDYFEQAFALLAQFVAREGHADVPWYHHEEGVNIGNWVMSMRLDQVSGQLRADWLERLSAMPGWVWLSGDDIHLVGQYARREGHTDIPLDHREEGRLLGEYAVLVRDHHKRCVLSPSEQEALEAIPGWHW